MTSTRDFMGRIGAIGSVGSAFYFQPGTVATGKEHGLDGFRFYFLGRGGVLGDVEPEVVASAFGYFNPTLIKKMWSTAKERMEPRDAARLYLECAHDFARARLAGVDGLAEYAAALGKVNEAIDPVGLALFAGVAAEPVPEDPAARAMHVTIVNREGRGSTHLLAVRAVGLSAREAHQVRRPDEVTTFGWEPVELTGEHESRWGEAEELTDRLMEPAFAVLDEAERAAVVTGLERIAAAIAPTA